MRQLLSTRAQLSHSRVFLRDVTAPRLRNVINGRPQTLPDGSCAVHSRPDQLAARVDQGLQVHIKIAAENK